VATADDAADAARARDEIEGQARLVYAAALAWVALHGEDEEPPEDSTLARTSKTLGLMLLRSMRRLTKAKVPMPVGEARQDWIASTGRDVTKRAVEDARSHWSTVYKRAKAKDRDVEPDDVATVFRKDRAWSEAAARTRGTQLAAEAATHRRLHGTVREVGDPFHTSTGHDLRYPGDPEAPIEEWINCRCALFLVPTAEKAHAEEVFNIPEADFDVPMVASPAARAWEREQAKRDWHYELGMYRTG
jgi:hypothetical protein